MQQTIQGDCTELTAFVCEHLSVCSHKPFFWKAACCIHHPHRKHEQDQLFLGPLLYLLSGKVLQVSSFVASVLLQIKLNSNTLKLQSIQNNTVCDQESGKVNICNFSVFEGVTNFSFIVAYSPGFVINFSIVIHEINCVLQAAGVWRSYNSPPCSGFTGGCRAEPCWRTRKILFLLLKGYRLAYYLFIFYVKFSAAWGIFVSIRSWNKNSLWFFQTLNLTHESQITSH